MAQSILGSLVISLFTKANTSGLEKTDRAIRRTTKSLKDMSTHTSLIGKLSNKLFGGIGIDTFRRGFLNYLEFEKQLGSIHSRFYAITKDSKKANQQFDFARKIAKETATDINNVVDSYSIFYASAQRALGEGGAQEVYTNWTRVARVLHLSGTQYERVMYALREMSSKGQLYAQDLMIQMGTHVPDIRNIAEESIKRLNIKGVSSIKDFQEYTKKNTGSDAMARFLVEFSREARGRFASDEALKKALQQPDALATQIKIFGQEFLIEFSKAGGSFMIVKILQGLVNFIKTVPFDTFTKVLGSIARGVGRIFDILPQILITLRDIALMLVVTKGIFGVFRFFGKIKTLFNELRLIKGNAGFINKLTYSLGKAFPSLVSKGILEVSGKIGLKSALGLLLNGIPLIGQILSVLMWIWTVIDIIKTWFPHNKESSILPNTNLSNSQILDILRNIDQKAGGSLEKAYKVASYYKGGEQLIPYLQYSDNGKIEIHNHLEDKDYDIKALAEMTANQVKNAKKEHSEGMGYKPRISTSGSKVDI